jgi:ABC-type nitrate/sulfonate/bicarbonate transport system substrate-binding protein
MSHRRWYSLAFLSFAVLLAGGVGPAAAQTPPVATVVLAMNAPGSGNWPVYIADQQGFFKEQGLNVEMVLTGSNTNTINAVATGGANIALDGSDIEIEAAGHGLPLKIVAPEFGPNPYTLVVAANIGSWSDLKGKTLVLGSAQDVSSLTFARMAAAQHLQRSDFTIVNSPSSSSRYAALISGTAQATVLSQPFDILAIDAGYRALASGADVIPVWADTCFAVNTTWAAQNHGVVVRFVRALRKAVRFGYANPSAAISALIRGTNVNATIARKAYDVDFRSKRVFVINDRFDLPAGLRAMADTARAAGVTAVPRIEDVYDPAYMNESAS